MKKLLLFVAVIALVYSFSGSEKTYYGYSKKELRDLYGSGNPELWPEALLFDEAREGFQDVGVLPEVKFPESNPYSKEKEELGKLLFFDPRLSKSGQISCASCHDPELFWGDVRRVSYGHDRQLGKRNTPTILNIAFADEFFWDGRAATLESQVKIPVENPVEMNMHSRLAAKNIRKIRGYRPYFIKAFGDKNVTEERIAKAIATFERTLVSPKSKFDRFISGEKDLFTDSEVRGLHFFRTKANCINCHNTPYFSDGKYHNLGLTNFGTAAEDLGRYDFTKDPEDVGKFKTPTLREVSKTGPYMHNGSFADLREVLEKYGDGMDDEKITKHNGLVSKKSKMIEAFATDETELDDIENFLRTLHSYKEKIHPPALPKK